MQRITLTTLRRVAQIITPNHDGTGKTGVALDESFGMGHFLEAPDGAEAEALLDTLIMEAWGVPVQPEWAHAWFGSRKAAEAFMREQWGDLAPGRGAVAVHHSCYGNGPDALRVYAADDPYLKEHPGMYWLEGVFSSVQQAEAWVSRQF